MKEAELVIAAKLLHQPAERLLLLSLVIGPEGETLLLPSVHDNHAEEVGEASLAVALDIKIHVSGLGGQNGPAKDVNLLLPHGQSLQGMVMGLRLPSCPLAAPPGMERA